MNKIQNINRPCPPVESPQNLRSANFRPVYPKINQTMINYNLGNQCIPAIRQQPRPQYYQIAYIPNIINPYSQLQSISHPAGIYYYYPN